MQTAPHRQESGIDAVLALGPRGSRRVRERDALAERVPDGGPPVESDWERMLLSQPIPRREGHETLGGDPLADTICPPVMFPYSRFSTKTMGNRPPPAGRETGQRA